MTPCFADHNIVDRRQIDAKALRKITRSGAMRELVSDFPYLVVVKLREMRAFAVDSSAVPNRIRGIFLARRPAKVADMVVSCVAVPMCALFSRRGRLTKILKHQAMHQAPPLAPGVKEGDTLMPAVAHLWP